MSDAASSAAPPLPKSGQLQTLPPETTFVETVVEDDFTPRQQRSQRTLRISTSETSGEDGHATQGS